MCLSVAIDRPHHVLCHKTHSGYEFIVVNNGFSIRCGYVRLPKGHPWHGKDYDEINVDVHGGITFAEPDVDCGKGGDDAYWIGFDCGHAGDLYDPELPCDPGREELRNIFTFPAFHDSDIRTQEYVEGECMSIIDQAIKAAS